MAGEVKNNKESKSLSLSADVVDKMEECSKKNKIYESEIAEYALRNLFNLPQDNSKMILHKIFKNGS